MWLCLAMGLSGSATTLCLKHHQLLEGESFTELHKAQEYQLHDQECQKLFIYFFIRSVEKNSSCWSKFLQFWGLVQTEPPGVCSVCPPRFCLSVSGTDKQIPRKEKLLKMHQNKRIFHLPNCQALCQSLLSPWCMGVLDLGWQPLQE